MTDTNVSLRVEDIEEAVAHLDEAVAQGAFKGWDTIIKVYNNRNNLFNFVNAANAQRNKNTESSTDNTVPQGEAE